MRYYLILLTILMSKVYAQMVSAPGLTFTRAEYGHNFSYFDVGQSITSSVALGATYYAFTPHEKSKANAEVAAISFLVKRWNNEDSQANIYLYAGAGRGKNGSRAGTAEAASLQVDWENRRYHVMLLEQSVFFLSGVRSITTFHAGWAPYTAEYDEIAPWIYITEMTDSRLPDKIQVGPEFVLMYKGLLLEFRAMRMSGNSHLHYEYGLRTLF
jgi:hypothetical protein